MANARAFIMRIGETLIHQKSITNEQLDIALWVQKRWGGLLGRILCSRGYIVEADLTAALSSQLGFPAVGLANRSIPIGLSHLLPVEQCVSHLFLPFGQDPDSGVIQIAMMDPRDPVAIASLRSCMTQPFRLYLCGYLDLTEALYRAAHARENVQVPVRRTTQVIIEADALVEEVSIPESVMRPITTTRMELSAGYEVIEESEMLEAMAAQAKPARHSGGHDIVVDSCEFEILSTEEDPATPEKSDVKADLNADTETSPKDSAPTDEGAVEKSEETTSVKTPEKTEILSEKKLVAPTDNPLDPATAPVGTSGDPSDTGAAPASGKKPPEPGTVRRGLMAALGGSTRPPEKKPPPSPFGPRGKK